MLEDDLDFLNHGAFGACPLAVLEQQQEYRDTLEHQPLRFLVRELEDLIDASRQRLARALGGSPQNLVFVSNATHGVNTVLRSLQFKPGEAILLTNHGYNAVNNAARFVADHWGLQVNVAEIPVPLQNSDDCLGIILDQVHSETRLAILDHVTSPTGLVFPIESLTRELRSRGVQVLIDGAHAPGMVPVQLDSLAADFYTGNCHKWLCAPKGAAFLYIAPEHHQIIRPLSISHGANSLRRDRSRLHLEFDWTGTFDPTPWICVRDALDFVEHLLPGGLNGVMQRNHQLTIDAVRAIERLSGLEAVAGDDRLLGSLASFLLPDRPANEHPVTPQGIEPLQDRLLQSHRIEVPIFPWPKPPRRLLRIACQMYNDISQYRRLGEILGKLANEKVL